MLQSNRGFDWRVAGGLLLLVLPAPGAYGTAPHLSSVVPVSGQRGVELVLTCRGERLQDTQEIIWYEPGLEINQFILTTNKVVKAKLKISPECQLGEHHMRLRTASGLSELRTFFVGAFPVIDEKEPNNLPAQAQPVPLNTTVAGVITGEDVDCFAVQLKGGQRLSAEVQGMRLGRGLFDPRLSVLETNGTVLADVDDTWLGMQDPFLSLVAPHDGTYILQLREATYGGGGNCYYLLHVGTFPRPTSVFPLGGKAGDRIPLTFFSETAGEFVQDVQLPATPQERFGVFAELDHLPAPSPNWVRVSSFPNVLASSRLPGREHATIVEFPPPFALNGILALNVKEHWFRFPAARGVPLQVDVFARQLRSPLDSVLEVFDAAGHSLAANDDAAGADSALRFTPAAATNYFVCIRDLLGRCGRDFTYRIEVTPVAPSVTVKIPEVARGDTQSRQFIVVPRGNRIATLISAKRSNFSAMLELELLGLPPGVTMRSDQLAPQVDAAPVVFEATLDAPVCGRLLDFTASGTNANARVTGRFHNQIELVQGPNNTSYCDTRVDRLCVAVTKEAPFHLRIVEPNVPLVQSGSMALRMVADRAPGFEEPIEVQMVWNPPGVTSQSEATIPKGATSAMYQLNAAAGAAARAWKVAALGHATVDGGQVFVSSQLANLEVATPFVAGKIEPLTANPGSSATLTVNLQQLKPFEGKAKVHLLGLPERISARDQEITSRNAKVCFELAVDRKCSLGSFRNLFCAVEIPANGQTIPHTIAAGGILRIVPASRDPVSVASTETRKR